VEARLQEFNINVATQTSGEFTFGSGPTSTGNLSDPNQANSDSITRVSFLGRVTKWGWQSQQNRIAPATWMAREILRGLRAGRLEGQSKLTVNAGFRYEIPTPVTEAHGQQSFMNPTLANPARQPSRSL